MPSSELGNNLDLEAGKEIIKKVLPSTAILYHNNMPITTQVTLWFEILQRFPASDCALCDVTGVMYTAYNHKCDRSRNRSSGERRDRQVRQV